jgi:hypothetical protein
MDRTGSELYTMPELFINVLVLFKYICLFPTFLVFSSIC